MVRFYRKHTREHVPRIALFASGNGSNLENLARVIRRGKLRAAIAIVLCDRPEAFALRRAERLGLPHQAVDPSSFPDQLAFEKKLISILKNERVDYVVLAGFMRILSPFFVRKFRNCIVNIHPALLPAFRGHSAIRDAYDYGVRVTGVTVHLVDEGIDSGAIVLQQAVRVEANDTLKQLERKIHEAEYQLYPKALQLLFQGRLKLRGRKVFIEKRGRR